MILIQENQNINSPLDYEKFTTILFDDECILIGLGNNNPPTIIHTKASQHPLEYADIVSTQVKKSKRYYTDNLNNWY